MDSLWPLGGKGTPNPSPRPPRPTPPEASMPSKEIAMKRSEVSVKVGWWNQDDRRQRRRPRRDGARGRKKTRVDRRSRRQEECRDPLRNEEREGNPNHRRKDRTRRGTETRRAPTTGASTQTKRRNQGETKERYEDHREEKTSDDETIPTQRTLGTKLTDVASDPNRSVLRTETSSKAQTPSSRWPKRAWRSWKT